MKQTYDRLHVAEVPEDKREQHMGYRYLVTNRATSHTAFHTRKGLERWAKERNLTLPDFSDWIGGRIKGSFSTQMHMDMAEFLSLSGSFILVISNARYTMGIVTEDNTVHYLNPNVKERPEFNYRMCSKLLDRHTCAHSERRPPEAAGA